MWSIQRAVQMIITIILLSLTALAQGRWSEQQARDWYARQPWLVGSNYNPASAINQLEMWQADSFDPKRIDLELGWAEGLGMNTMRVFLHDLLWQQDAEGFKRRLDQFLTIAAKHKIKPMFVLLIPSGILMRNLVNSARLNLEYTTPAGYKVQTARHCKTRRPIRISSLM